MFISEAKYHKIESEGKKALPVSNMIMYDSQLNFICDKLKECTF